METTIEDAVYIRPEVEVTLIRMRGIIMTTSNGDDEMTNGGFLDE